MNINSTLYRKTTYQRQNVFNIHELNLRTEIFISLISFLVWYKMNTCVRIDKKEPKKSRKSLHPRFFIYSNKKWQMGVGLPDIIHNTQWCNNQKSRCFIQAQMLKEAFWQISDKKNINNNKKTTTSRVFVDDARIHHLALLWPFSFDSDMKGNVCFISTHFLLSFLSDWKF